MKRPLRLFPLAVTLRATALIFEGDGRPALYLCAEDRAGQVRPYRVTEDTRVTTSLPRPLPTTDKKRRVFLPENSHATFEAPSGSRARLELHAVRVARELLEALEAYSEARASWQVARELFENSGAA